jgi:hypothetical protein
MCDIARCFYPGKRVEHIEKFKSEMCQKMMRLKLKFKNPKLM